MNRDERERANRTLEQIDAEMQRKDLTPAEREELEHHAAAIAGQLLRPWLPIGWGRRLLGAGIIALGIYGLAIGNYEVFVWWILLPLMSPRTMGEVVHAGGRIVRALRPGR